MELQKRNAQLRSEKSKLENIVATMPKQDKALRRDLCDKEKTIKDLLQRNQTLRHQVESLSREKEELQSQFETLKFQVDIHVLYIFPWIDRVILNPSTTTFHDIRLACMR